MKSSTLAAALSFALLAFPAAAQECGGDFNQWLSGMKAEATAAGVGARGLAALDSARMNTTVLSRDRAQGVFAQTFTEFSGRMISGYRLKQGAANLKKYADTFARAEQEYGVPGPVIAAFWALETDFGAVQGDFDTLDALATLAHDCRRPELFRRQIVPLLKLIDSGTLPADVKGAWAGEIGQTQILPSDYLEKGRDGDGDGIVDLRGSAPDVIMTTGNFLQSLGWRAGEPWMEEVRVPDEMDWSDSGRENQHPRSHWAEAGVTRPGGSAIPADDEPSSLVLPMGRKGPAFLIYPNFDIYLEWNKSLVYTLTAGHLAARLGGAKPYDPRSAEPGLTIEGMKRLQTKLQALGYDVGKIDGVLGTGTRTAVQAEQKKAGLPADGWPSENLLSAL
ncbi:MAG: lytic murein transglycosylase [Mesorhizobium sp.]|nr:lytic murein transglycosylase [Mesorhizobium sp.]